MGWPCQAPRGRAPVGLGDQAGRSGAVMMGCYVRRGPGLQDGKACHLQGRGGLWQKEATC